MIAKELQDIHKKLIEEQRKITDDLCVIKTQAICIGTRCNIDGIQWAETIAEFNLDTGNIEFPAGKITQENIYVFSQWLNQLFPQKLT